MELIIDNRQDKLEINEELIEKIKDIISECLDYEGYDDDYEVSLSFVDNKEIQDECMEKVLDLTKKFPIYKK